MNAKTTATRAKRGHSRDYLAPLHALNERDRIGTKYLKTVRQQELLGWMDRTPAERQREVQRLWGKADRKYQKVRELTYA